MSKNDYYELDDVALIAATDGALLVRIVDVDEDDAVMGEDQWWIPRSLISATDLHNVGDEGYVEIPEWFAEKEGIC